LDKWLIRLLAAAALAAVCALIYRSGAVPPAFEKGRREPSNLAEPSASLLPSGADFDFYVLALSWSPSYCASKGGDADPEQCGLAKPPGFTAHGLWPQFERGSPQNCAADSRNVSRETGDAVGQSGAA
jgi:ribonuclease T2